MELNPTPSSSCPNSEQFSHNHHHKNLSAERYAPQFKAKVLKYLADGESDQAFNEKLIDNHQVLENQQVTPPKTCKYGKKTIAAAALRFKVHPTTISDWVHNLKRNSELKKVNQLKKSPSKTKSPSDNVNDKVTNKLPKLKSKTLAERKQDEITQQIVTILRKERLEGGLSKESNLSTLCEKLIANLKPLIIPVKSQAFAKAPWFINWWSRFSQCNSTTNASEIGGNSETNGDGVNSQDQKRITVSKV